jgi:acetylornithine deacetylase/succinyl-diaminopimelate desuccinylase-like protein
MTDITTYLEAQQDVHLKELFSLLRIPSVSTDPGRNGDVADAAAFVCQRLIDAGFEARIHPTDGHPIITGEWLNAGPDAPTVLVYGHYDVQPPEPLELWRNPPFEPTLEGGNIVARGATDDKGQMYAHIKGAQAHLATAGTLPVNVKFLIEGEEEVGSPNLEPFLREHKDTLAADAVLISDSSMFAPGQPSIMVGLRGLTYVEVHVTGPSHDLHSGLYGGSVKNPINALAEIIAQFHDADGRIAIDGFYDNVLPITDEERDAWAELPFDKQRWLKEVQLTESVGEVGYSIIERTTGRPTLDCNGIWGGYTGKGAKTVLPSEAHAKVSCRLVPNQTPDEIEAKLRAFVEARLPKGVTVEVTSHHGGMPVLVDFDTPAVRAAREAQRQVWGKECVFTRGGGSIPIVASFKTILGVDSVLMGLGNDDDRLHSPNEKFGLENYYAGIRSSAAFFAAYAAESSK